MKPEDEEKLIEALADQATGPMDVMMKKQSKLTQEMLKYSFELGQRLGYIGGYADAKAGKTCRMTPEALLDFMGRVRH